MFTIPEVCMQYTQVFQAAKFEMGVCLVVGMLIGYALGRKP